MDINNRPDHIEDYLTSLHTGQWYGWAKGAEPRMVYSNLIIHPKIQDENNDAIDNPHSKPTEQECTDGLAQLQTDFDNIETQKAADKTSGNNKLKALGLTDDEITAITS